MVPTGDSTPVIKGSRDPTPQQLTPREVICAILLGIGCTAVFVSLAIFGIGPIMPPEFLVKLTVAEGLDPLHDPVIQPSFNLTLRAENNDDIFKDCWKNVTITVFYGDTVVGWGSVPNFCMARLASIEVNATMSHTDVMLTDGLRRSMVSELVAGELEFGVAMRMPLSKQYMSRRCNGCSSRQSIRLGCVKPGQGYALTQQFVLYGVK